MRIKFVDLELVYPKLESEGNLILFYCDFNVANYLYESKINISQPISFYHDSTLVHLVLKYFYKRNVTKQVSTEFLYEFLHAGIKKKKNLFFFGDKQSTLEFLSARLKTQYPGVNICGMIEGYNYDTENVITAINQTHADILFVGLGVGRQEKWICENLQKINSCVILSAGGWFRLLSGEKKRAPGFIRKICLEWLYKLVTEFARVWKRYFYGIPKFIFRVVKRKIIFEVN